MPQDIGTACKTKLNGDQNIAAHFTFFRLVIIAGKQLTLGKEVVLVPSCLSWYKPRLRSGVKKSQRLCPSRLQ